MSTTEPALEDITTRMLAATTALRNALATLEPGGQISMRLICNAFAAVRQMAEARHITPASPPVAADREALRAAMTDYHATLAEWYRQLSRVHGWLLAERNRLAARRGHTDSLKTWLETNRQTR